MFYKGNLTIGIKYGSEAYESMVEGWHKLDCSREVRRKVGNIQVSGATRLVWLSACSTNGNLEYGWVKVDSWRVFQEVETTGSRVYNFSVVLVVARYLGLERGGATANIRRSIKCLTVCPRRSEERRVQTVS